MGKHSERNNNDDDNNSDINLGRLVLGTLPTLTRLKSVGQAYGTRALALIKSVFSPPSLILSSTASSLMSPGSRQTPHYRQSCWVWVWKVDRQFLGRRNKTRRDTRCPHDIGSPRWNGSRGRSTGPERRPGKCWPCLSFLALVLVAEGFEPCWFCFVLVIIGFTFYTMLVFVSFRFEPRCHFHFLSPG